MFSSLRAKFTKIGELYHPSLLPVIMIPCAILAGAVVSFAQASPSHIAGASSVSLIAHQQSTKKSGTNSTGSQKTISDSSTSSAQVATSSKSATSQASSTSNSIDFSFSSDSVSMYPGGTIPTVTAKTTNGAAVYWVVWAPSQAYMLVTSGLLSSSPESSHSFAINSNPVKTLPGTYTGSVTAYYAGHLSTGVTKTFTIQVLPTPTFELLAYPNAPFDNSTPTDLCVPYQILWSPTVKIDQMKSGSAVVLNVPSGVDVVDTVQLLGGAGCVMVNKSTIVPGNASIQVTNSDGTYSTSVVIPYQFN